ncbi:MAG: PrsW family intramembrane metalloprotease [Leptospiraceae bacterium]|nr:PrsW family intramembrane metalloprotease [Leptospiraceae bacterium]MCP5498837.1 PrsW family intramembrane metalloprotease [Leptospiraceae bacterium]
MPDIYVLFNSLNGKDVLIAFLAFLSVFPWAFVLFAYQPSPNKRKLLLAFLALCLGILSTKLILSLHEIIWPKVDMKPVKSFYVLKQTVHLAFIQAGVIEETFKILFILILSFIFAYHFKSFKWNIDVVIIAGFVALGFSLIENFIYLKKTGDGRLWNMFTGRALYSSNIHLLINLSFSIFLLKSNINIGRRITYPIMGFLLAIFQHGVVDFFLIPHSRIGSWLATALFVGIWVWVVRELRAYVYKT